MALLESFRTALASLNLSGLVHAIDCNPTAPALQFADRRWLVPRCDHPEFVDTVLDLAIREGIELIVPTIDTELEVYANARQRFRNAGINVAISSPLVAGLSADKWFTYEFLKKNGLPAVPSWRPEDGTLTELPHPLIAKPRRGSASKGVRSISSPAELEAVLRNDETILQTKCSGAEYTVNFFVDSQGRCLAAVPHERLEVRSGEVSKGVTRHHPEIIATVTRLAEALPGAYGALNAQGFLDADGQFSIFEINARFGGGYPLTHAAGAHFTNWLISDTLGNQTISGCDHWRAGVTMLRYDAAVFLDCQSLGR